MTVRPKAYLLKALTFTISVAVLANYELLQVSQSYMSNSRLIGNSRSQFLKVFKFQPENETLSKKVNNISFSEKEPTYGGQQDLSTTPKINDTKKILLWNDFFFMKNYGLDEAFLWDVNCPFKNCVLTEDKREYDLKEVDAVLWHPRGLNKSIPNLRGLKAKLVFFNIESPMNLHLNLRSVRNKFNLIYTYRADADVPFPYGVVVKREKQVEYFASRNFHANKTFMAVWFTSHCPTHSKREILAKTLQRYNITAHVYGMCGDLSCPYAMGTDNCLKMVQDNYYFYFSFENSLCEDYLTEKVFQIYKFNMIPVVYGLGPYRKHLPPHSYIDIFDYSSIEDLADYLTYLTLNKTAYNEYFRWKVNMKVIDGEAITALTFCHLCEILNTDETKKEVDIENWFVKKSRCLSGSDEPISNFINGGRLKEPFNKFMYRRKDWSMTFDNYETRLLTLYNSVK